MLFFDFIMMNIDFLNMKLRVDKNPHPDAKDAFDALKDAYDTLMNAEKRKAYDQQRIKQKKMKQFTFKRVKSSIRNIINNWRSLLLLSYSQWKRHEPMDIFVTIKDYMQLVATKVFYFYEHLMLLPTFSDRLQLIGELIASHRKWLIGMSIISVMQCVDKFPSQKILLALLEIMQNKVKLVS